MSQNDNTIKPNFSQRVLDELPKEHKNFPYTREQVLLLLATTSPWELDLLMSKGLLNQQEDIK